MRLQSTWAFVLLLAAAAAAAQEVEETATPSPVELAEPETVQQAAGSDAVPLLGEGIASWYGLPFHGRRTASGERFDMNALTAAHPSLPFGTRVRVHAPHNGRSVVVRINDRGPHTGGRIIDLSHAAARALGLLAFGTRRVVLALPEAALR